MELGAGIINYQGDLQQQVFTFKLSRPSAAVSLKYEITGNFVARTGFFLGSLYANDKFNKDILQQRNLNFRTKISEVQVGLECYLINLQKHKFSPYIFFGIAAYHYNSYTNDNSGVKTYLQPLSTEGQGLSEYPATKYKLKQAAIPYGGGLAYKINCNSTISLEFAQRKLFTDYLDDVSLNYVDYNTLLTEKGPKAVELAYRGGELPGGAPYPINGSKRGNPYENDWYYAALLKFSFNIVDCNTGKSVFGKIKLGKEKDDIRCPRNF
jgi:hypothetical protein